MRSCSGSTRTGRIGEVFTHGAKVGSTMALLLDDACAAVSPSFSTAWRPARLVRAHAARTA